MAQKLDRSIETEKGTAAGYSSTFGFAWDLSEDSPELQWPHSIVVYDRMIRQDAQVRGVYNALVLPILQAHWMVAPQGARPELVAALADDLGLPVEGQAPQPRKRLRGRFSWGEHMPVALLKLIYGHMPFNQVYSIVEGGPFGLMARIHKLSPRFPRTLTKIDVAPDGDLRSITQANYDMTRGAPPEVEIPIKDLVYYVNERQGGAWQGQSILRSSYKNWTLKDRLLRVAAMTHERNGMGVPEMRATIPGLTQKQMQDAAVMAEKYRAGDKAGFATPYGFEFHLRGVEGSLPDALPMIRYHDEQITKPMQEMFMQLGSTQTGSRALGSSFIDFFGMALNAVAGGIAVETTQYVVEDWVNLNYGEEEPAPAVVCKTIDGERDIDPASVVTLVEAGAVEMDDDLEAFLRQRYGLPARNAEQLARPRPERDQPVAAGRRRPLGKTFRY